jgi:hypothetical protein
VKRPRAGAALGFGAAAAPAGATPGMENGWAQGSGAVGVHGRWERGVEEGRREGSFQPAVGVGALAVALHARWSECGIFSALDCAKWRAWNIISTVRDFNASVGAAKIHLRAVDRRFFGRGAILAPLLEMLL